VSGSSGFLSLYIKRCIENGFHVDIIHTDCEKVFASVSHLKFKIKKNGVSGGLATSLVRASPESPERRKDRRPAHSFASHCCDPCSRKCRLSRQNACLSMQHREWYLKGAALNWRRRYSETIRDEMSDRTATSDIN
jgi:hypothetical protein